MDASALNNLYHWKHPSETSIRMVRPSSQECRVSLVRGFGGWPPYLTV